MPGRVVERTLEAIAASVYSLSSSAPHLFGERLSAFDKELRELLAETSDGGWFSEQMRSIAVSICADDDIPLELRRDTPPIVPRANHHDRVLEAFQVDQRRMWERA